MIIFINFRQSNFEQALTSYINLFSKRVVNNSSVMAGIILDSGTFLGPRQLRRTWRCPCRRRCTMPRTPSWGRAAWARAAAWRGCAPRRPRSGDPTRSNLRSRSPSIGKDSMKSLENMYSVIKINKRLKAPYIYLNLKNLTKINL